VIPANLMMAVLLVALCVAAFMGIVFDFALSQ
jgi:hypothetical protein